LALQQQQQFITPHHLFHMFTVTNAIYSKTYFLLVLPNSGFTHFTVKTTQHCYTHLPNIIDTFYPPSKTQLELKDYGLIDDTLNIW
jgi:hypothetical protein